MTQWQPFTVGLALAKALRSFWTEYQWNGRTGQTWVRATWIEPGHPAICTWERLESLRTNPAYLSVCGLVDMYQKLTGLAHGHFDCEDPAGLTVFFTQSDTEPKDR